MLATIVIGLTGGALAAFPVVVFANIVANPTTTGSALIGAVAGAIVGVPLAEWAEDRYG